MLSFLFEHPIPNVVCLVGSSRGVIGLETLRGIVSSVTKGGLAGAMFDSLESRELHVPADGREPCKCVLGKLIANRRVVVVMDAFHLGASGSVRLSPQALFFD